MEEGEGGGGMPPSLKPCEIHPTACARHAPHTLDLLGGLQGLRPLCTQPLMEGKGGAHGQGTGSLSAYLSYLSISCLLVLILLSRIWFYLLSYVFFTVSC